jgi:hypothetical protein
MRKLLKFVFYILSFLFLLWQLIPVKVNFDKFYIQITYVIFLVSYIIYESIQLTNDDKIKGTPFFINRIKLAIICSVLLLLFIILIRQNSTLI